MPPRTTIRYRSNVLESCSGRLVSEEATGERQI
jgi:hypothetical protein